MGAPLVILTNALGRNLMSLVILNTAPDVRYKYFVLKGHPEENKAQKIQGKISVCSNNSSSNIRF